MPAAPDLDTVGMEYYCNLCRTHTLHRKVLAYWDNTYYIDKKIYSLVRCHVCGLVEVENKPTDDVLARYYQSNYSAYDTSTNVFTKIKAAAARAAKLLPRVVARRLLLDHLYAFASTPDASVLDLGCGDGSALQALKALGFTNLYGTEIDPSRRSVLEKQGIGVVITSDITTANLPKGSFDVV